MQTPNINIRVAGREDAALIADMSRRTFYATYAAHNTKENMDQFLATQFAPEKLMEEVGAPRNTFLLVYVEGEPAGYARLFDNSELPRELAGSSAIEIARIYCEEHAKGKGAGKALIEACQATGKSMDKDWIWLSVWEQNHNAIGFYTKMGFEIFGKHLFILGHDLQNDWYMRKRL